MGVVSAAVDAVVALFSLIMAVTAPLFDSQVVLPLTLYPLPLVDIFRWLFDHYLAADPPPFFRGLVWLDLALLWPVSVANLYGILTRRPWSATTSLMAGVHMVTYLFAIFGEMFSSGRETPKLILLYVPFIVFAVASVMRGLCSCSPQTMEGSPVAALRARKKRFEFTRKCGTWTCVQLFVNHRSTIVEEEESRNRAGVLKKRDRQPILPSPARSRGHEIGRHPSSRRSTGERGTMGVISAAVDAAVALFSLTIIVAAPLIDAQSVLPHSLFPAQLLDLKRWYAAEFDDYLVARPPGFFRGLVWLELVFHWPLAVANLYGLLTRRRWASTTSLMAGVSTLTSMSAVLGEMFASGKATPKLLLMYVPFAVFAVIAILRGLCSCSQRTTASSTLGPSARKKRFIWAYVWRKSQMQDVGLKLVQDQSVTDWARVYKVQNFKREQKGTKKTSVILGRLKVVWT
ncbi:hypothetical protein EJB05_12848, partial [Eragrostis curvula]